MTFLWGLVGTPMAIALAEKFRLLDVPGGRKKHRSVMPRGAGLVLWSGYLLWALFTGNPGVEVPYIATGATMIFIVGYMDDMHPLPPLVRLIARLAEREVRKELPHAGKGAMTFEKIRNFVEYHFSEPIGREDIAAYFHLHPSYVSQLFRQYAGRSLQDYITACRIARAKDLLSGTDAPVKQIAEECGFGGEVYFIRRFREIAGVSPGRYRLANRTPHGDKAASPEALRVTDSSAGK